MTWDTLRPVLLELHDRNPCPIREGPDPHIPGERRAPFHLRLEAWAIEVAESLHHRFGRELVISVGYFGYPNRVPVDQRGRPLPGGLPALPVILGRAELADPAVLTVDTGPEPAVASGREAPVELVITNHTGRPVELRRPLAFVVDPDLGATVGDTMPGWAARSGPAVEIAAHGRGVMTVLVGTASRDPQLGYAVPAGEWALRVFVERSDGHLIRAPLLPLTVT